MKYAHPFELTAQTPAKLAEEFIVKSIWFEHFSVGSELPSERELAEKIGITRTTLREVLHRLARDGWLQIQHGKATKVNDIWRTAGTSIIPTLLQLDPTLLPTVIKNVVSLRTKMGESYILEAISQYNPQAKDLFKRLALPTIQDDAQTFAQFDYNLYREFAFLTEKPVYGLVLNSFQPIYLQVASLFFHHQQSREFVLQFYQALKDACETQDLQKAQQLFEENQQRSQQIWQEMLKDLPAYL